MKPHLLPPSWLPWLLFLPLGLLVWPGPGAPLTHDPFPHLAGTGLVTLASLPAALWLALSGRARPLTGLLPLLLLFGFVSAATWLGSPSDPFESRRAWLHLGNCVLLFALGAQLDQDGRRLLNRGLVVASLLLTSTALVGGAGEAYGGVLGNSGSLSQAALPGAVIGAWYVVSRRGLYWNLGLIAYVLYLTHAGLAPVLAGGLTMLLVLLLSCFLSPWSKRKQQVRGRLGILAALSIFSLISVTGIGSEPRPATEAPVGAAGQGEPQGEGAESTQLMESKGNAHLGGVGVRFMIWSSLRGLLGEHAWLGVGPGQFQAAYPPYRDPREIVASRGSDPRAPDSFVNHAHNDLFQGLAELGLLAGGLWIGFWLLMLRAGLRALKETDFPTIASGAAALSLLVAGLFHAPLTMNPLAAPMACLLFGVVSASHPRQRGLQPTRGWRLALAALPLVGLPTAWGLVAFGSAFSSQVRANRALLEVEDRAGQGAPGELLARAIAAQKRAIEIAPSSAPSRFNAARNSSGPEEPALWQAVLEVRPHSVEALDNLGVLAAKAGDVLGAREAWGRALALSPSQPRILENLARLEILEGEVELGIDYLARRRELGALRPGLERHFGAQLILRGAWEAGTSLLLQTPLGELSADAANAAYLERRKQGPPIEEDALRSLSQLLYGREHVRAGDYDLALRNYDQALRPTRKVTRNGAAALRAELSALHLLNGDSKQARLEALGLELDDHEWQSLPDWARLALGEAELIEGR